MNRWNTLCLSTALVLLAALPSTAGATTLQRMGLDELTTTNQTIVLGEVIDAYSYWNRPGTFILTDVRVKVLDRLKGEVGEEDVLEITLMGGSVGDLTTLVLAGAELIPETSYVLFLDRSDLPGIQDALTVRDHSQGVFEVTVSESRELRAASQASDHELVPDASGESRAPGGPRGLLLDEMIREIRAIVHSSNRRPGS